MRRRGKGWTPDICMSKVFSLSENGKILHIKALREVDRMMQEIKEIEPQKVKDSRSHRDYAKKQKPNLKCAECILESTCEKHLKGMSECRWGVRRNPVCEMCGKEFVSRPGVRFCSDECRKRRKAKLRSERSKNRRKE